MLAGVDSGLVLAGVKLYTKTSLPVAISQVENRVGAVSFLRIMALLLELNVVLSTGRGLSGCHQVPVRGAGLPFGPRKSAISSTLRHLRIS